MLLAGFSLSIFIKGNYEETTHTSFDNFSERARATFKKIHVDSRFYSEGLSKRNEIKNAVNLISEYSDINDYQSIIYDSEKKNIARVLYDFAKSTHLHEIRVYDKKGWLVAFSKPDSLAMGIVSFSDAKPIVMTSSDKNEWKVLTDLSLIPKLIIKNNFENTQSYYYHRENIVGVESVSIISRTFSDKTTNTIGQIYVVNSINESVLTALSKGSSANHTILLPGKVKIGDDVSGLSSEILKSLPPLFENEHGHGKQHEWSIKHDDYYVDGYSIQISDKNVFYLISSLNKDFVNSQINETVAVMIVVFVISVLVLLPVGLFFSRYTITDKLDKLVQSARSIEKGNYETVLVNKNTSYEIYRLTKALNSAVDTVKEREEELRKSHNLLEQRVEERTKDLSDTNEKLQEENAVRLRAEEVIAESEEKFRKIVELSPFGIALNDKATGRFIDVNPALLEFTGYKEKDFKSLSYWDLTPKKYAIQEEEQLKLLNTTGRYGPYEKEYIHKDGYHFPVLLEGVLIENLSGDAYIFSVIQDITNRKRFENELISAKESAEHANQAKSEFLSRMSHELRTPLNAILGFAQLLELDLANTEDKNITANINEIIEAGDHLLELINEVLDLARIESGGLNLSLENVSVHNVIDESIKITQSLAESNNITIENLTKNCEQQFVYTDETRLKQIFINFITNAIKYNNDGGTVSINCTFENESEIKFTIADNGIGISQSNIEKLFNPFERLGIENQGIDGTGIGLVICKELIENMNGKIGVESKEGEGSTFWFTLPCYAVK